MNLDAFLPKLPLITRWIDSTLAAHATDARPVATMGFERLPGYYSAELLSYARVVAVPRVPVPPLTQLGLLEFGDFERGDYTGITFKNTYFVQAAQLGDESLHFHELVHVIQWTYLGVEKFLLAYAVGLAANGYRNSPLEKMAYGLQVSFNQNEAAFDVEKTIRNELDRLEQ